MIRVHHLENSRSQRILWLLEELGQEYEVVSYARDPETKLAPPELKAIHPLGKSPVVEFERYKVAESGAAVELLVDEYGHGMMSPERSSAAWPVYIEWLHYAEGSAMLPLMMGMYVGRLGAGGAPLMPRIASEVKNNLDYIAGALGERTYLLGEELSGADVQMFFVLEAVNLSGALAAYPTLVAYRERMQSRPAFHRAIERGGPFDLSKLRS